MEVGRSRGAHMRGRDGAPSGLRGAAERVRRSEGGPSAHGREEKGVRRKERGKKRNKEKRKGKKENGKRKRKKERRERDSRRR